MKTALGRGIAVGLVLIGAPMSIHAEIALFFDRHWDNCILQPNSKLFFEKQDPRLAEGQGISKSLTDQIDSTVRQELSRQFALNDPDSDFYFFYKGELQGYVPNMALMAIGFCRRGEPFGSENCTRFCRHTVSGAGFTAV